MRHVVIRPGRSRLIMTFCFAAYMAQNGICLKDIYLLHRYSQRSWVRFPFRPEFFSGLISQLLKLSIYCDDHHLLKINGINY